MNSHPAVATALRAAFGLWRDRARALQRDRSLGAIHDFRVSSRRLMTVAAVASSLAGGDPAGPLMKTLKAGLQRTSEHSDLMMAMRFAREHKTQRDVMGRICSFLAESEQGQLERLDDAVPEAEINAASSAAERMCGAVRGDVEKAVADLDYLHHVQRRLRKQSRRMGAALKAMDRSDPSSVHELRVQVRRTRYLIELFRPFAGDFVNTLLEPARDLQELMGAIHDRALFIERISKLPESAEIDPGALKNLKEELMARQAKAIKKLVVKAPGQVKTLAAAPLSGKMPDKPTGQGGRLPREASVVLLRHATAVARGTPGVHDDALRALMHSGRKEARRAAGAFETLGIRFSRVITSPALRALETARIVADHLGAGKKLE
ncbi:MAG: CHAD domain-containing protein, partial [Myxococcota bacterium]